MNRLLATALVACIALAAPTTAFANMIKTFAVSGAFAYDLGVSFNPGSTVTIDTTTGLATGAAMSLNFDGLVTVPYNGAPNVLNTPTEYAWSFAGFGLTCFFCDLDLQNTSGTGFMNFAGGTLTGASFCNHCPPGFPDNAIAIVLTPVSQVPEPTSLALFATALVGLGAVRRRKREGRPHPTVQVGAAHASAGSQHV